MQALAAKESSALPAPILTTARVLTAVEILMVLVFVRMEAMVYVVTVPATVRVVFADPASAVEEERMAHFV